MLMTPFPTTLMDDELYFPTVYLNYYYNNTLPFECS